MTAPQVTTSPPPDLDAEHLRLLSIFHYIVAGFAGLFALFPFIHVALGIAMVTHALDTPNSPGPPAFLGWFFIGIASVLILIGLTLAVLLSLAAKRLQARTHYTYCFVLACISTVFFPFGTALGVFMIIVLSRSSVKALFDQPKNTSPPVVPT